MKKIKTFLILGFFPFIACSQRIVNLTVNQPVELKYEVSAKEFSISKGDSVMLASDLKITGGSGSYTFRWSPGSSLNDSTLKNPVARPSKTTTYLLTTTDKNGCGFKIDFKVTVMVTAVEVFPSGDNKNLNASVFPNPNDGFFKIHLTGKPVQKIEMLIIDNLGRVLFTGTESNFEGELTETIHLHLPSGIYSIFFRSEYYTIWHRLVIR